MRARRHALDDTVPVLETEEDAVELAVVLGLADVLAVTDAVTDGEGLIEDDTLVLVEADVDGDGDAEVDDVKEALSVSVGDTDGVMDGEIYTAASGGGCGRVRQWVASARRLGRDAAWR